MKKCSICKTNKPSLKRPKTNILTCIPCFLKLFEDEIHLTITKNCLFSPNETIAIGISGGKDSTVLAHIINKLNPVLRHIPEDEAVDKLVELIKGDSRSSRE